MASMPKTRAQQETGAVRRRLAAGAIDEQTARELTACIREAEAGRIWAAALDAAQQAVRHG